MNLDLSVAPEIAQLAAPLPPPSLPPSLLPAGASAVPAAPALTAGQLASGLRRLAAAPQRWWDLVRFNPDGPVRVPVPAPFEAWLLVIPPGQQASCQCAISTLVAGEAEQGGRPLRQGRARVNGTGLHLVRSAGHGYSLTLHARS